MLGLVEILLVENLEAEVAGDRLFALAQDDAVVAALFHGAQIDRVRCLVGHLQAERIDIKGLAAQVVGPHVAGEAVLDVIRDRQRLGLVPKPDRCQDRAEDFLLGNAHVVLACR
jgi:hypothetical protein